METILVTGATGHLGKEVVSNLLDKPRTYNIAAFVRDASKATGLKEKGAEIRLGDYTDYQSLLRAFKGIDKLYFVSSNDVHGRKIQHDNVVKAAGEAGIKHIVYTGFEHKNETASSPIALIGDIHTRTTGMIVKSGINFTILNHIVYSEYAPFYLGNKVLENSTVYFPSGDGKIAFLSRSDMAEIGANVLITGGHDNKIYAITGDAAYSFGDIAEIISGASGKFIKFISPTAEEYAKVMSEAGVAKEYIEVFNGFAEATKQGEFDYISNDSTELLGRKPGSFKEYIAKFYAPVKG